jgi:hypothetical protein
VHVWPAAHTFPQKPQLVLLFWMSMHMPLLKVQLTCPAGQLTMVLNTWGEPSIVAAAVTVRSFWLLAFGPSLKSVCALPSAPVATDVGMQLPPPAVTAKVTFTPETALPYLSRICTGPAPLIVAPGAGTDAPPSTPTGGLDNRSML